MGERPRRYLDEPLLVTRLALERARDSLRQLARDQQLPPRLRTGCAGMFRQLGRYLTELRRTQAAAPPPEEPEGGV